MVKRKEVWLVSEEGILDLRGKPLAHVPFQGTSADMGAVGDEQAAVIADEHEVWIHADGKWELAASSDLSLQCLAWTMEGRLLVGTERARLAWVEDGALRFLGAFDAVPERDRWNTPFGAPPAVRSLAVAADDTLYANVHVGWIARSTDGGETWTSLLNGLEKDVHQVVAHPSDPGTVFAATATGFHFSRDHGDAFERRVSGLPYYYQRATACFQDRDIYLVSTAIHDRGVGAALYRSEDEGRNWERVQGLPQDLNRNIDTHQLAALEGGRGLVVVDDTAVYETTDWGITWTKLEATYPRVWGLLVR